MKNNTWYAILFLLFGIAGIMLTDFNKTELNKEAEEEETENKIPLKDRMDLAWQQEFEMTKDPKTGDVPKERLYDAWLYLKSIQQYGKAALTGVQWQERGPNNQGGRTRAILVDLNDVTYKTVWVGSVGGGLWKTTDITATAPAWTVINDFFQNLAITSIAQDPVNKNNLYFSTGEASGNSDAIRGMGVWKSSDGGTTWNQLSATNNSSYNYSHKIFVSGADTVFVCTNTGLYRSVNGGTSFTKVLGSGIASAGGDKVYDIEKAANGTLYTTASGSTSGTGTIHKSYNKGATWSTPLSIDTSFAKREIQLGLSNNDTNTIWGLVENGGRITAVIKSINAGNRFDTTSTYPVDADSGIPGSGNPAKDFSRGQAWYDLSIAVDPNNSSICFVGGVDLFRTSNGGSTWAQIAHWYGGFGYPNVHADQHIAMFSPGSSSIIYFGNDGGIYRSTNATATPMVIDDKGTNYITAQFYACAIHPAAGTIHYLAGAQDNGSHRFTSSGVNSTVEVTGGDGAFCHIDQKQPSYQYTSYVYNNYYRSTNGGSTFSGVSFGNTGRFINPTDYDDSLGIMYGAYNSGKYMAWTNARTGSTVLYDTVAQFNGSQVSAVKVSPNVLRRVYFGTGGGRIVKVDSANFAASVATHINVSVSGMPTTYVSCIEVETGNENHIIAVYSNYGVNSIWETKNGGTSWTSIEGNLPDMPIRWIVLNPTKPWQALVATELGVWSTDSIKGTSTVWGASSSGLANVRVDMLQLRASDKMVIAATHGRGLFSSDIFMDPVADFSVNQNATYQNKSLQFTSTSVKATTWLWNFGDGTTSTLANPKKSYPNAGLYSITLSINGGASVKTSTNYISVLPYRGVPYAPSAGGNFETNVNDFASYTTSGTAFARGNSTTTGKSGTYSGSNAWVTGLTGNYLDNTVSYLYTPNFNFTLAGTYNLRFYAKNIFEIGYDGYRVEYSTDTGNTWIPLATTTSAGWYDYANTSTGRPFPQNQAYFNSTNSAFTLKSYNTSFLAGNTQVCFRFIFIADPSANAAGLALDDFEILGPTNNPLPVSLLSFKGKRSNKSEAELTWMTGNEISNKGFELERKFNWNDDFEFVTFVKGKGMNNTTSQYAYTDNNDNRFNSFYRLKQIDNNGEFSYSDIIVVNGYEDLNHKIVRSVIPLTSQKTFIINLTAEFSADLEIINNSGQLVKHVSISDKQQIDLQSLATGIYYFRFVSKEGNTQVEKVFVR